MAEAYRPYAQGRYYKFEITSNGSALTLRSSDIAGAAISGTRLKFTAGFHAMDAVYDINSVTGGTAGAVARAIYIYADGIQAINLPGKDQFDKATIYVFGKFEV